MGKVTFQREGFAAVIDEADALLFLHWKEVAHYPDIPLAVDRPVYEAMDAAGILRIYTARDESGKLIGYAAFIVGPNSHYSTSGNQAKQDVLFVAPDARLHRVGLQLVKFCDAQLQAEGIQVVMHHVKLAHPALGRLLVHEGYEPVETIFAKRLDIERV